LIQVLSYEHVLQLFASTFVSSFQHERVSTVRKIYTKMQCKIYSTIFNLFNYKQ
jgi:hypothetical protein